MESFSSETIEEYIKTLDSPSKKKNSKAVLNLLSDYAKGIGKNIESLTADDFKNFEKVIVKKVAKNTTYVYLSNLRSFIDWVEARQKEPTDNTLEGRKSEPSLSQKSKFDYEEWMDKRDNVCPDCQAEPYRKDGASYIYCPRPNWIGKGKTKGLMGEVRIEACLNKLNYYSRITVKKNEEKEGEIVNLKAEVERLKSKLDERQSIEADMTAQKIRAIQRGESIYCHLKKLIIPLHTCFDLQNEYAKTPKHFIPPSSEYCPCQKFEALETVEMAKYKNVETIPWMNPEIKDMSIVDIEKLYGLDNNERFNTMYRRAQQICINCINKICEKGDPDAERWRHEYPDIVPRRFCQKFYNGLEN